MRRAVAGVLAAAVLFGAGFAGGWRLLAAPAATPRAGFSLATVAPESAYELLLKCQLPSGAMTVKPEGDHIIPYFANLTAMALIDTRPEDVKEYLEWYLARLNRPDRWGLAGTIYDFKVDPAGRERPTGGYDSADSYAATFLTLVRAYLERTGDRTFVLAHLDDLRLVASVITALQDADGLVWAKASRREKYLMDNAEDFRGMADYSAVLASAGRAEEAAAALAAADRVRQGVEARLWNARRGNYDWGVYTLRLGARRLGEVSRPSAWSNWYPDTVAQVFPVVSGLLTPSDPRALALYENLNAWHPGWIHQAKRDPHPWSILGYAAALLGDAERASVFIRATAAVYLAPGGGPYYGLSWELAYQLLTVDLLGGERIAGAGRPGPAPVAAGSPGDTATVALPLYAGPAALPALATPPTPPAPAVAPPGTPRSPLRPSRPSIPRPATSLRASPVEP